MLKVKFAAIFTLILSLLYPLSAAAAEVTVDPMTAFCFSSDDFSDSETNEGIFITAVPQQSIASVLYGGRVLKAGDALTSDALDRLTLETSCVTEQSAVIEYCTVSDGKVTGIKSLKMNIHPKRDDPPIAENGHLETYKNIENSGVLQAYDPEGKILTYQLTELPKRGTVEIGSDGTFTYTPKKNKVGKDKFSFAATDEAGNVSAPAEITVEIINPADKTVYADMTSGNDRFNALWLKEKGLFTGPVVGGTLCFGPDEPLTRGEFLVMVMKLVNADRDMISAVSGFADEDTTPAWMQPYIASAYSSGMITGTDSDEGVVFRPSEVITKAEAAVLLQNILQLPVSDQIPVFAKSGDDIPSWASEAVCALAGSGITLTAADASEVLTRSDAAAVLYDVSQVLKSEAVSSLYWLQ